MSIKSPRASALTAVLCLALAGPVAAGLLRPRDARFVRLSSEQGLSQDTVFCVVQDHQRFLWIGTEEGLNRYDGYSFKVYKNDPKDPASLPSNWISQIYEDRAHRLWVGTIEGLSLFDRATETFRNFRLPSKTASGFDQNTVTTILEDRRGQLWVGTLGGGVNRVDPATGAFVATYRHKDGDATSLSHNQVQRLHEDGAGRIWVGTTEGLNLFDPERGTFVSYRRSDDPASLGHDWVWDIAGDRQGRVWVATYGGGMSLLDPSTQRFRRYQRQGGHIPNDWITSVFVDREGMVWAGSDGSGLLQYDPAADAFVAFKSVPRDTSTLGKNVVRTIYEDTQANLWVGTYKGGLSMLQRRFQAFAFFTHDPLAADSMSEGAAVNAVIEDKGGAIWVGTSEGGLNRFDREEGTFRHFRSTPKSPHSLSNDTITSLHQDRQGRIWLGSHGGGLDLFDPAVGVVKRYAHRAGDALSLGNDYVWAIAEHPDGALWLGTNGGLDRFDPATGRFTHHVHDAANEGGLSDSAVRDVLVEENGDVWVATLGGLDLLASGSAAFTHFRHDPKNPQSLSNNAVVTLRRDAKGRMWVGTLGGGMNLFDTATRRFTAFRAADGLPAAAVYSICDDPGGDLWLGTNKGLARFNPERKEVKSFGLSNGLRSLSFNLGSCGRTHDGRLLFGSADGLYFFDPAAVKTDTYVPPVAFTSLRLFGQPATLGSTATELRLAYWQNLLSLEFAALDFTVPRANAYSYTLEGFRPEWTALGPRHEVTFTNLDPGHYTLRIRASNSDGVWNETGASLQLFVAPPFWKTWWFRGLMVAAFAGLLLTIHRVRTHNLHERARELTRRVEEEMARVQVLSGLLPICASCRRIREDTGYWRQIEAYVQEHSTAKFSHGVCPDCWQKMREDDPLMPEYPKGKS